MIDLGRYERMVAEWTDDLGERTVMAREAIRALVGEVRHLQAEEAALRSTVNRALEELARRNDERERDIRAVERSGE